MTLYILAVDWCDGEGTDLVCAFKDRAKAVEQGDNKAVDDDDYWPAYCIYEVEEAEE